MAGIGITPEASVNNPVLYDLFFETIWADDGNNLQKINLDEWFKNYVTRRYGADSDSAYQAMEILHDTVYNPAYNMKGQGAPESVVNARPGLDIGAASTWGNAVVDYDKKKLEKAAELLLADYDKLKNSAGYQYDLANVLEQVLSNTAQEYQKKMAAAFRSGDAEEFSTLSDKFLSIIDMVEKVTGTQKEFLVGTWINGAKKLAENSDDFTKELYELNARSLITTWGSYDQAISGGLIDYSNRQWAGLTNDYYKMRWEKWITERKKELAGESYTNYSAQDWFEMEWAWARGTNKYSGTPNGLDLQGLGTDVLANYSLTNMPKDPAEDDSRDLPLEGMTATAGSEQATTGSEGPASAVLDQTTGTIWHSKWSGDARENLWIDIALGESKTVTGLRMLPRSGGGNGTITSYRIEISNDHGKTYQEVATGTWNSSDSWKMAEFHTIQATNVRLYAVESVSDSGSAFASAAEIRIMGQSAVPVTVDKSELQKAVDSALTDLSGFTEESQTNYESALASARKILADDSATQETVDNALAALQDARNHLVKKDDTPKDDGKTDDGKTDDGKIDNATGDNKKDDSINSGKKPADTSTSDDRGSTDTTTIKSVSVKTGDSGNFLPVMLLLSVSGTFILLLKRKRA